MARTSKEIAETREAIYHKLIEPMSERDRCYLIGMSSALQWVTTDYDITDHSLEQITREWRDQRSRREMY